MDTSNKINTNHLRHMASIVRVADEPEISSISTVMLDTELFS